MNNPALSTEIYTIDTATGSAPSYVFKGGSTISAVTGANGYSHTDWNTQAGIIAAGGTIDLKGENADIRVNGVSLMNTLNSIAERLNILRPNPELEAEWHKLKELGDQYRALEKEFKEKSKVWEKLTAMPPPTID